MRKNITLSNECDQSRLTNALKICLLEGREDWLDRKISKEMLYILNDIDPLFDLKVACARAMYAE